MQSQKQEYKRKRDVQVLIMIDEKERDMIHKRMNEVGISNRSAYLRKMALNGRIILVRLDSVDEMVRLLSDATDCTRFLHDLSKNSVKSNKHNKALSDDKCSNTKGFGHHLNSDKHLKPLTSKMVYPCRVTGDSVRHAAGIVFLNEV